MTASSALRYLGYASLGVAAATFAVAGLLPLGVTLACLAGALVLLLPLHPRAVAALSAGLVLTLAAFAVSWATSWGCASEVDGRIVEHDCGHSPSSR